VQLSDARTAVDKTSQELEAKASDARDEASKRWSEVRENWNEHIAKIRERIDADKAERDAKRMERRAQRAEDDATAVGFALLAIQEAEYEVLDAALARAEADEFASAKA
jgi:hypothetical protein